MEKPKWKKEIYKKLDVIFEGNAESFTRILFYLDKEVVEYKATSDEVTPAWRTLKLSMNNNNVFKSYAQRLADDTKKAENDVEFRKRMGIVYEEMMDPSDKPIPEELHQHWDIARLADMNVSTTSGFIGLAHAWNLIPVSSQTQILELIPRLISNKQIFGSIDEIVGLLNKTSGNVVMVGLAAIHLSYEAYKNLSRWWTGEISGKRCAKNIVDSMVSIAVGVAGGIGGAALGTFAGPPGIIAGGILGGILCSTLANFSIDRLTQKIFGVPKDERLEKAYNFFGLKMSASNHEINSSFRKLCLEHHPDKGGNCEDFLIVQLQMGIIKLSQTKFN